MFRKGFASFLIAAAATAAFSTSVTAQVRSAALQTSGFQLAQAAQEENRIALVIGNSAYQANKPLNNPVNDAQAGNISLPIGDGVISSHGQHGIWVENEFSFDASLLKQGQNTLKLTIPEGNVNNGVIYDYIRLELADGATARAD